MKFMLEVTPEFRKRLEKCWRNPDTTLEESITEMRKQAAAERDHVVSAESCLHHAGLMGIWIGKSKSLDQFLEYFAHTRIPS